jgi:hypothetical protein
MSDQAERAELVLHPFAVAVAQLALVAVEHRAGEVVAAFLEVAHALDLAAIGLVVDVTTTSEIIREALRRFLRAA